MKYLSVCSGIEAATVAWHPLGWEPVAFGEIEPFPCSVLAHHYPTVPNLGDMTKFKEWNHYDIDVFVGGTPCQSFSVAGLRKGLDDPRGNLMLTYLAIADKYRPRWLVWENVPGVLSSNGGRDFGTFLGGLGQLGYGFAYRVLDAQYFGVAQRRRRVFVVGCLGDWRGAAAVLFERHSLQGHPAPSRQAGQEAAKCLTRGANQRFDYETEDFVTARICGSIDYELNGFGPDLAVGTLMKGSPTGGGKPLPAVAFNFHKSGNEGSSLGVTEDRTDCLRADSKSPFAVAFDCKSSGQNGFGIGEVAAPLRSMGHANSHTNGGGHAAVQYGSAVRRLTPVECERLQGFPDNYTNVPHRGKPAADGPRYKALGNSMAVPVMAHIGRRIALVDELTNTKQKDAA